LKGSESDNDYDQNEDSPEIPPDWPVVEVENPEFLHEVRETTSSSCQSHEIDVHYLRAVAPSSDLVDSGSDTDEGQTIRTLPQVSTFNPEISSRGEWPHSESPLTPVSQNNAQCLWPLQNTDEVILLRHFITDLCPWVCVFNPPGPRTWILY
jgi:hypothetical protein